MRVWPWPWPWPSDFAFFRKIKERGQAKVSSQSQVKSPVRSCRPTQTNRAPGSRLGQRNGNKKFTGPERTTTADAEDVR